MWLAPLHGQLGKYLRTKGFKSTEFYDPIPGLKAQTNRVKNVLSGAEGEYMVNGLVRLTKSRLENYPPRGHATNLVAVSPESFFDPSTKLITGTGALQLVAADGRLSLRGWSGYQYSMTNSDLIVSNRARAFIDASLYQSPRP
jgi:hypothetical protein